ncbi:MAG: hypothetical protein U1E27_11205, partial [Kiritimatiellia bacterium]|nr:hypothetical protein [Kiritimatiellia bacterium]
MNKIVARIVTGLFVSFSVSGVALAQSVWTGGAGNWSSNSDPGWNGTGIPNAIDAVAITDAATGTIAVNGVYTVGTLTHQTSAGRSIWATIGSPTQVLVFDVSSGNAQLNLGTNNLIHDWAVNIQLNDPLQVNFTNISPNARVDFKGLITGTGGFITDIRGATNSANTWNLALWNTNNTFSGGITTSTNSLITLLGSGTAGTGNIVLGNHTIVRLGTDSTFVFSNNLQTAATTSYATYQTAVTNQTVEIYGNITGT